MAVPSRSPYYKAVRERARPIAKVRDLIPLIKRLSRARVVLLGEATHGTREFYELRRILSEWLITKHGFNFIAVEGDWPDARAIDRYVAGSHEEDDRDASARAVLGGFRRWPTWMWANTEVARLMEWMHQHNQARPLEQRARFYGLDVYSLFESMDRVVEYLEQVNPLLARRARHLYGCFDRYGRDEMAYARSTLQLPEGCESQVVTVLQDLLRARVSGPAESEELFEARQNARIVRHAEHYYRIMMQGNDHSWNIRDEHMIDTLELMLKRHGPDARGIVWAHNTHIGDYRATSMADQGLVNLGGLARERFGVDAVALVGFGTHSGSVVASHAWDGPIEVLPVPPAREESVEGVFHELAMELGSPQAYAIFEPKDRHGPLSSRIGHRAIGVVYDPEHERWGNYVPTSLASRYDAFVFVDVTRALDPLILPFDSNEVPETWPMGQ